MKHSTGLLLIDGNAYEDNKDFSFLVDGGTPHELHGWGERGQTVVVDRLRNPPAGNYHTVYLTDPSSPASRDTIRDLVEEHKDRYKECLVWAYPEGSELARWVANGMADDVPSEAEAAIPTDVVGPFAEGPDQPDPDRIAPPGADVPVHDPPGNPDVDWSATEGKLPADLAPGQHYGEPGNPFPADVGQESMPKDPKKNPPDKSTTKGAGFASGEAHQRLAAFEEQVDEEQFAEPNPDAKDAAEIDAEAGLDVDLYSTVDTDAEDDGTPATKEETGNPDLPEEGQEIPNADDPAPNADDEAAPKKKNGKKS